MTPADKSVEELTSEELEELEASSVQRSDEDATTWATRNQRAFADARALSAQRATGKASVAKEAADLAEAEHAHEVEGGS
jgi:hypothetical protein